MSTMFDWHYFETQTGGEADLQRELIELFVTQADELRALIGATPALVDGRAGALAAALHRLKGSARSIGAFGLGDEAERAESRETTILCSPGEAYGALLASLDGACGEAAGFIAARQATPLANMRENG